MKRTEMRRTPMRRKTPRRNDSGWREECLQARGRYCRSCGDTKDLQVDHVVERSQGGPSVVENGLVLCGPWNRVSPHAGGCHQAKTEGRMVIEPGWLDSDQIEWLAACGYVWWTDDGSPAGRLCRGFGDRRV